MGESDSGQIFEDGLGFAEIPGASDPTTSKCPLAHTAAAAFDTMHQSLRLCVGWRCRARPGVQRRFTERVLCLRFMGLAAVSLGCEGMFGNAARVRPLPFRVAVSGARLGALV